MSHLIGGGASGRREKVPVALGGQQFQVCSNVWLVSLLETPESVAHSTTVFHTEQSPPDPEVSTGAVHGLVHVTGPEKTAPLPFSNSHETIALGSRSENDTVAVVFPLSVVIPVMEGAGGSPAETVRLIFAPTGCEPEGLHPSRTPGWLLS